MDSRRMTEELNLKAYTAISNILTDYERGVISKGQAATGVRAVFDAVGGLVSSQTLEHISMAGDYFKGARGYEVQWINKGQHLEGVMRVCGTGAVVRVFKASAHVVPRYNDSDDADALARDEADRLMRALHQ